TKSGIYGGCIIESGPQSIIIVSNVRSLRHEIMKAYVHNYVFDVGQLYAYQQRMGQNANIDLPQYRMQNPGSVATVDSVEQAPEEAISNDYKTAEVAEENTDDLTAPVFSNDVTDTANPEPTTSIDEIHGAHHKNAPGISEDCDFDITSELPIKTEDASNKKKSGGRRATSIILLIIVILLLIAFGVLAYYFVYLPAIGVENNLVGTENGFFEGINAILNGR
ncbi:MAG: hypothetical protein J6Q67_02300, partial [Clostridia bacterium]|nr:hypothetical protein [Clostridia bacterium]